MTYHHRRTIPDPCRSAAGAVMLAVGLAGCGGGTGAVSAPAVVTQATEASVAQAALAAADAAARDCPFPGDVDQYPTTTIAPRSKEAGVVRLGVFDTVKQGCAVLVFQVGDGGVVAASQVLSANPPEFAAIAPKVLRWSNFAAGEDSATQFMVRLGAQVQPDGSAIVTLGFRDSVVNILVPK